MTFYEANARAKVLAAIKTVADYGTAYDYERFVKEWATLRTLFVSTISGNELLRGWTITLADMSQYTDGFGGHGDNVVSVTYIYRIRGFQAVSDSDASEKTFHTLVLNVVKALDSDANLHTANLEGGASSYFVSEPCSPVVFDYRMFGGVLCHFTEISKEVKEYV